MKRIRLLALLCAILMILSTAAAAVAAPAIPVRKSVIQRAMGWDHYALVKNKKTVTLYTWPSSGMHIADKSGLDIVDILVDAKVSVKAKTSAEWITLAARPHSFTILGIDQYMGTKNRIGKITVTGKKFKGTIKVVQLGRDEITSAKRKKNKLTVNYALGGASYHWYAINRYKLNEDGTYDFSTRKTVKQGAVKGSNKTGSLTVKVAKGYYYDVQIGPAVKAKSLETGYNTYACYGVSIAVTTLTGTEDAPETVTY